ncbi:MAG: COX15/CtaA family protein [Verrucomicrobiota bacterium]
MSRSTHNPWLHRFAVFTAICTLLLIALGGLVTSHEAGMAVPDWPTTYGYNMFLFPVSQWVGGIFYEHTHRLWASEVGLLTLTLMCLLFGRGARWILRGLGLILIASGLFALWHKQSWIAGAFYGANGAFMFGISFGITHLETSPKWLRRLGSIAFFLVVLQGILGGLRVTQMKDEIGIFHATLAQIFLVLICAIALFTSRWWQSFANSDEALLPNCNLRRFATATTFLILFQLVLGATMRHQHAGLAIPDFPLAYGKIWPATDAASIQAINQNRFIETAKPITQFHIVVHMLHRLSAFVILGCIGFLAFKLRRTPGAQAPLARLALIWLGMICAQFILGIVTVLKNKPADIATAHVVLGAGSLMMGAMISLIANKISVERENRLRHVSPASSVQSASDSEARLAVHK